MNKKDLATLETITGHKFVDIKRLTKALTHSSLQSSEIGDYERLEFLGDRILGLIIAEMLYCEFPNAVEGELSVRLNSLVNSETCYEIALEIDLPNIINMGAEMKQLEDRRLTSIYADVIEALIACIYLDSGLDSARTFIVRFWGERMRHSETQRRDPKTELQEWAHQQNGAQPSYRVLKRKGPDHDPVFEIEVRIPGFAPATGKGSSKRLAERAAAEILLYREGVWTDDN